LLDMADATIYHNPRCTKSRQALQVAMELGADVEVVKYLDTPPDAATLRSIIAKLDDPVSDLVRRDGWKDLGLTAADVATEDGVVDVLVRHPELLQRPIIVTGDRAVIGRPTERVNEILGT
jgi:arsenate reductase